MFRSPRVLQTSFLPLLLLPLLLALLVPLATAFCDQARDAIAFAAFTDWCRGRFEGAVITDEVQEKSSLAGRWCRTGDGTLRSFVAYDLKAD